MSLNQTKPIDERLGDGDLHVVQFNATYEGFGMVMDFVARRTPFAL